MRFALGIVSALAVLAIAAAPGAAVPARASLPDIEDEVMCAECGTALNVSNSPVAEEERDFIRALIAKGKTKEEIKAALVDEYGPEILALPEEKGVSLGVYLGPAVLVLLGALAVATTARRWRRAGDDIAADDNDDDARDAPEPDAADARRLDAELARFDR